MIISFTRSTALTDSFNEFMASVAIAFPLLISSMEISIRFLVEFAALELSSASFPISSATTANPFPASPARAASMEALSDRRFVWSAISSIVCMMPTTCCDVCRISFMASIIMVIFSWFCSIIAVTFSVSAADASASL